MNMSPEGLYQDIELPVLKWEVINMDFVIDIPRSQNQFNSIWVIIDRMTKYAHFFPVRTNFLIEDYARLYLHKIVKLHGSHFWRSFQKGSGTKVSLSTTFHLQSDGQVERTILT